MLKKLSLRFTAAAITALFVIELIMILLINGLNFHDALKQADEMLDIITENNGQFPEHMNDMGDPANRIDMGGMGEDADSYRPTSKPDYKPDDSMPEMGTGSSAFYRFGGDYEKRSDKEMRYTTRYFTAFIDADGNITKLDTGHIASVSSEQAQEYAMDVFNDGSERGFYQRVGFRYAVCDTDDGGRLAVFYDFSTAAASQLRMAEISVAIALGLLVVFSVMIFFLSKRVVRPIAENIEKQSRFITDAGHELKTPLAIIRANTEVIEMTGGESEWTRSTINQTDRLSDLLSRMLMLAKSQESQRFSFEKTDLSKLAEELCEQFSTYCTSQNKPLETDIAEGGIVSGDRKMLDMLISTLLENAVKYGKADCGIRFTLSVSPKHVRFSVVNLCTDPPDGDLDLLFDRFYRGDSSRTRETGGSGIGLSIAKTITDAHKGRIACEVDGEEVTFKVRLPLLKS